MRWFLLTALVASLVDCADPDLTTWHGDTAFTPEERAAIEEGAAFTAARVGEPKPTIVWDGTVDRDDGKSIYRRDPGPLFCKDSAIQCIGSAFPRAVFLKPALTPEVLRTVAAHEFGHEFGLVHHAEPGIMAPTTEIFEWTPADQRGCEAVRGSCPK